MDTFNPKWIPEGQPEGEGRFLQRKVQFGDGYTQRAAEGINPHLQSWPLSWVGAPGGAGKGLPCNPLDVRDFLVAHVGRTFLWTPPAGVQGVYACEGYTLVKMDGGLYRLTATLIQDANV